MGISCARDSKGMIKTTQDIIGQQCIRNDDGALTVSDEDKKITSKSHREKLLNTGKVV